MLQTLWQQPRGSPPIGSTVSLTSPLAGAANSMPAAAGGAAAAAVAGGAAVPLAVSLQSPRASATAVAHWVTRGALTLMLLLPGCISMQVLHQPEA